MIRERTVVETDCGEPPSFRYHPLSALSCCVCYRVAESNTSNKQVVLVRTLHPTLECCAGHRLNYDKVGQLVSRRPPENKKHITIVAAACVGARLAAINRAVEVVPAYSVVAVLSTSARLLPGSNADALAGAGSAALGGSNDAGSEDAEGDIFVAYERMRGKGVAFSSDSAAEEPAITGGFRDGGRGRGDQHGRSCHDNSIGREEGLLVTAMNLDGVPRSSRETGVGTSAEADGDRYGVDRSADTTLPGPARSGAEHPPPPEAARQRSATSLSDMAPLPLLVFDTETLLALGELDERFAFQGGIAEWISRAESVSGERAGGTTNTGLRCRQMRASPRRRRDSPSKHFPDPGAPGGGGPPCSGGRTVRHVHSREWGKRLVRSWPEDGAGRSRGSAAERGTPDTPCRGAGCPGTGGLPGGTLEERRRGFGDSREDETIAIDPWSRVSPAELESLVQADADLFFLPLLLEPSLCR